MDNPCIICADYPNYCRGICKDKMQYINEVDEDVPVVRKNKRRKKSRTVGVFFKNGKVYEYNKNGIRREVSTR